MTRGGRRGGILTIIITSKQQLKTSALERRRTAASTHYDEPERHGERQPAQHRRAVRQGVPALHHQAGKDKEKKQLQLCFAQRAFAGIAITYGSLIAVCAFAHILGRQERACRGDGARRVGEIPRVAVPGQEARGGED